MESIEQVNYIKASIETVYQALTSEEGLGNVWTKKLKVKPEVGFVNEFVTCHLKKTTPKKNKNFVPILKIQSSIG